MLASSDSFYEAIHVQLLILLNYLTSRTESERKRPLDDVLRDEELMEDLSLINYKLISYLKDPSVTLQLFEFWLNLSFPVEIFSLPRIVTMISIFLKSLTYPLLVYLFFQKTVYLLFFLIQVSSISYLLLFSAHRSLHCIFVV